MPVVRDKTAYPILGASEWEVASRVLLYGCAHPLTFLLSTVEAIDVTVALTSFLCAYVGKSQGDNL